MFLKKIEKYNNKQTKNRIPFINVKIFPSKRALDNLADKLGQVRDPE